MDTTDYSSRSNAKRAAEKMISTGTAPAIEYGIKPSDDDVGRFDIVWKTANGASDAPTTGEVEAEIAEGDAAPQAAPAATGAPSPEAAPQAEAEAQAALQPAPAAHAPAGAESEPDPFPAGSQVQLRARTVGQVSRRLDDGRWAVEVILSAAEFIRPAARNARTPKPAGEPRRSKSAELDEAAAKGVMPTKPDVTSHANHHYQKRFDKLAEFAAAGDWDAVAGYECNGVNSYAKMVRQYRDRLVTAHKAQEAATAQGAAQ